MTAQRYRHIVEPVRIVRVEGGIAETRCNFLAVRIMHDGDSKLFTTRPPNLRPQST